MPAWDSAAQQGRGARPAEAWAGMCGWAKRRRRTKEEVDRQVDCKKCEQMALALNF